MNETGLEECSRLPGADDWVSMEKTPNRAKGMSDSAKNVIACVFSATLMAVGWMPASASDGAGAERKIYRCQQDGSPVMWQDSPCATNWLQDVRQIKEPSLSGGDEDVAEGREKVAERELPVARAAGSLVVDKAVADRQPASIAPSSPAVVARHDNVIAPMAASTSPCLHVAAVRYTTGPW